MPSRKAPQTLKAMPPSKRGGGGGGLSAGALAKTKRGKVASIAVKKKVGAPPKTKPVPSKAVDGKAKTPQAASAVATTVSSKQFDGEDTALEIAKAFMRTAAASALAGVRIGHGGPFGASIVRDGVVIACAHNMVLHCGDPTKHAEMTAIQYACKALGTHDLSDCDLYTTCEPCPMCWGAVRWSGLRKAYLGVDRFTAARYGFDDKVFYDEVNSKHGCYGLCLHSDASRRWQDGKVNGKTVEEPKHQSMVEIYDGVLHLEVAKTFADVEHNRTLARRNRTMSGDSADAPVSGQDLAAANSPRNQPLPSSPTDQDSHEEFMRLAIRAAKVGVREHRSKDREPFGAVIVKNGHVIAEAHNCVIENRDATATAEICAIRLATARLGTHNLEGCTLYSTTHPDLMSLGAILWARISKVYCGVTQQLAAQSGFEEGLSHIRELVEVEAGIPSANVIRDIAAGECEAVFQEWSSRNGIIY